MRDSIPTAEPLAALVDNHRAFLRYLERRVGERALAEDILQDAFSKVIERPDRLPEEAPLVPWFYRLLRNAAIDRFRREASASRALSRFAQEVAAESPPSHLEAEICACVTRLAATLKPEYEEALMAVDVSGESVKDFATRDGLSPGNAAVRLYRARKALKRRVRESCGTCAEHGCFDCTCGGADSKKNRPGV